MLTLRNGHQPSRIPQVESRTSGEGAEEAGEQVEEDRFAARRLFVAADGDADGVERRRRRRLRPGLRASAASWARRAQHAAELAGEDRPGAGERDPGKADGRPLRARPAEARARPARLDTRVERRRPITAQPRRNGGATSPR